MCRVCEILTTVGARWSIECPSSSRLWELPVILRLQTLLNVTRVDVDMCMFKPGPPIHALRKRRFRLVFHASRRRIGDASYPLALLDVWSEAVAAAAPSGARDCLSWTDQLSQELNHAYAGQDQVGTDGTGDDQA
eukprot:1400923-Amphidinium_carterae.4